MEKILEPSVLESGAARSGKGLFSNIKNSDFYVKLTNWEYWPIGVANLPLALIWVSFALRARRLFFFTNVNPVIETGGAWGESKMNILERIPSAYVPATIFVAKGTALATVLEKIGQAGLQFPVIAKPNVGERGFLVAKIRDEASLQAYIGRNAGDFLVQEFVGLPLELAVMYHRYPGERRGKITSICIKETLKVSGDGRSSIRQLMQGKARARLQLHRFEKEFPDLLNKIPAPGETIELEPIGNHCRGTMFLNGNGQIDPQLTAVFDEVMAQMDGIHYGRFDLKCSSIDDIRQGKGFQVMEFNGIGAEPAHIYDPSYPLLDKHLDIYRHWQTIYRISTLQARQGFKSMGFVEGLKNLQTYFNNKKKLAQG